MRSKPKYTYKDAENFVFQIYKGRYKPVNFEKDYYSMYSPISLMCDEHGTFKTNLNRIRFQKSICPKCANINRNKHMRKAQGQDDVDLKRFLKDSKKSHGSFYDYSKIKVVNGWFDKLEIVCPKHGLFVQQSGLHMRGRGCTACGYEKNGNNSAKPKEKALAEFTKRFSNITFPYFDTEYTRANKGEITAICKYHGEKKFKTAYLSNKKTEQPCNECSIENGKWKLKPDEVRKIINQIYKGLYEAPYIEQEYKGSKSYITLVCKEHGEFKLIYNDIVSAHSGCPKCRMTNIEQKIKNFLEQNNIDYLFSKTIDTSRVTYDFIIGKLIIEANGLYHHSAENRTRSFHKQKRIRAEKLGYTVINLWGDEIQSNTEMIFDYLKVKLGLVSTRYYARKCQVKEIDKIIANEFVNQNHLMRSKLHSSINIGIYSGDKLIGVFQARKKNEKGRKLIDLYRVCFLRNSLVIGGFEKMLKKLLSITEHDILSYVDRDKFTGSSYLKAGFEYQSTNLIMWYAKGNCRYQRQAFTKQKLLKMTPNGGKTERELAEFNKLNTIYNSGNDRLIYKR